ncbi:AraC family transcriptional regulator [Saccharopolyspora sp. NFXS83]|uniref:AraC family transcriptional regulator n=1 Tax=Saccharopolyspora sp. NFXS83 TaxID=2993560 RepID=UPI00224B080C|nr:AraC family transcriptional regulator [Saccharopolyspora sp. NFXS83]MCX2734135.1 AraC family transcriptional regulator [Saccharopolyspora sp. NFXS83]
MDLLADVLSRTGVRGSLGARIAAGQDWGLTWSGGAGAGFYAITAGGAWLGLPGHAPQQLAPGDVVLLPTGTEHTLGSSPGAAIDRRDCADAERAQAAGDVLRIGSGAARTHILGASFSSDAAASTQILAVLPEIIHVHAEHGSELEDTIRLLSRELARPRIATAVVLDRLVDILLIQLLRSWLDENPAQVAGTWLGVLRDPVVREAMTALHQDPAHPWTTEGLASQVAVSRATLTRRFLLTAGEAPGGYLTRWRMDLAATRLRDTDDTLDTIARSVGYTSVHAFSRAFSRTRGRAPGRYRLDSRAAPAR